MNPIIHDISEVDDFLSDCGYYNDRTETAFMDWIYENYERAAIFIRRTRMPGGAGEPHYVVTITDLHRSRFLYSVSGQGTTRDLALAACVCSILKDETERVAA